MLWANTTSSSLQHAYLTYKFKFPNLLIPTWAYMKKVFNDYEKGVIEGNPSKEISLINI